MCDNMELLENVFYGDENDSINFTHQLSKSLWFFQLRSLQVGSWMLSIPWKLLGVLTGQMISHVSRGYTYILHYCQNIKKTVGIWRRYEVCVCQGSYKLSSHSSLHIWRVTEIEMDGWFYFEGELKMLKISGENSSIWESWRYLTEIKNGKLCVRQFKMAEFGKLVKYQRWG